MSFQAVTWAIEQKAGSPSAKATLWSIANYATEHWFAWPKQATIANDSEQSPDSVQKRIPDLVAAGLVRRIKLKRHGRRTHDFYILRPSPFFAAGLEELIPFLPRGCDVMEDATADSGSVEGADCIASHDDSASDAAAASGSATLPQLAVDAAALARQPMEPVKNLDSPPTPPSGGQGPSAFDRFKEIYPLPCNDPERLRSEIEQLSATECEQLLHGAAGAAAFHQKNPKKPLVGPLRFSRSSALWAEYARFAPSTATPAPRPPRNFVELGSEEWRARAVLHTIVGTEMPQVKRDETTGRTGADFLGSLPAAGLVLARFASADGNVDKEKWVFIYGRDERLGAKEHPGVERDKGKVAAWRDRIHECIGITLKPGLLKVSDVGTYSEKYAVGLWVPQQFPPGKTSTAPPSESAA
jgi:hypothetical protein